VRACAGARASTRVRACVHVWAGAGACVCGEGAMERSTDAMPRTVERRAHTGMAAKHGGCAFSSDSASVWKKCSLPPASPTNTYSPVGVCATTCATVATESVAAEVATEEVATGRAGLQRCDGVALR
jgi:hypothetical protein